MKRWQVGSDLILSSCDVQEGDMLYLEFIRRTTPAPAPLFSAATGLGPHVVLTSEITNDQRAWDKLVPMRDQQPPRPRGWSSNERTDKDPLRFAVDVPVIIPYKCQLQVSGGRSVGLAYDLRVSIERHKRPLWSQPGYLAKGFLFTVPTVTLFEVGAIGYPLPDGIYSVKSNEFTVITITDGVGSLSWSLTPGIETPLAAAPRLRTLTGGPPTITAAPAVSHLTFYSCL